MFIPRQYQYLYCLTVLPDDKRTAEDLSEAMGVSPVTVYRNTKELTEGGFLIEDKNGFALTEKGLAAAELDRDTLDDLVFWFRAFLGYNEADAGKNALAVLLRAPIEAARRIAKRGALCVAMRVAGARAEGPPGALPAGKYDAFLSARFEAGDACVKLYKPPATFVADGEGNCALELRAGHVLRIAFADGRHRGSSPALWYFADGGFVPARAAADRLYIRGDALRPEPAPAENGDLVARVCVRVSVNKRHKPTEAALTLRIARRPDKKS